MGQFSNSFPKHFSYLCEYAIRFDLSCSFCEYPFIFHCLHCSPSCFDPDSLLLAYLWLGLSWIDCISANKSFSSSKTSSRKPYTSSKQQERHKHSVEITINFSRGVGGLLFFVCSLAVSTFSSAVAASCSSCAPGCLWYVWFVAVVRPPVACGSFLWATYGCPSYHASFLRANGLECREHRMRT